VTLFMFYRGNSEDLLYIAIATKKDTPATAAIDISRVEATPVVGVVETAPLAAVVDSPTRAEPMAVNDVAELVEINLLCVSVPVGAGPDVAVETVELETDVGVGPGIPLLVTNDLKISGHSHPR
jgi:hypothetical protein